MKYFSIDISLLSTPDFVRATAKQKGIWLDLYAYCAGQENNGIIYQSQNWPDSHWQRFIGHSGSDLKEDCPLWFFRSENLFMNHYDTKLEELVRTRRKSASIGGKRNTLKKANAARKNGQHGGRPKVIPINGQNGHSEQITQA